MPNRAVRLRHALLGGFVAALAFEIMKRGFALYIAKFPTYTLVYGAFAVIPIFLLWIYFSWVVIVIGALIAALAPDFAALGDAGSPSRTGIGDVLEPDDGILAIGSGGNFALAAARVLTQHTDLDARTIAVEAMKAAAAICVYTNEQIVVEEL